MRRLVWLLPVLVAAGLLWLAWPRGEEAAPPAGPGAPDAETPAEPAPDVPAETPEDAPTEAAVPAPAVVVEGRVVDERRFPVPGARVTAEVDGERRAEGTTDEAGRFRLGLAESGEEFTAVTLLAVATDGRAGTTVAWVRAGRVTREPVILLGPAAPLTVVTLEAGKPRAGALVRVEGTGLSGETGGDGRIAFAAVPHGIFEVRAGVGTELRGSAMVEIPRPDAETLRVDLLPARTVRARVVFEGSGDPVAGATLEIRRRIRKPGIIMIETPSMLPPVAPTDVDGWTAVRGIDPGDTLEVSDVIVPGRPRSSGTIRHGYPVPASKDEMRISVPATRTVRVPIVAGEAPVPPDGATIALSVSPGSGAQAPPESGRMEGSVLVIEDTIAGYFHAIATAPDGSLARVYVDPKGKGWETSFRRPGTVTVVVRDPEGKPAVGEAVALRQQGNNPVAGPTKTDGEGIVLFRGLYPEILDVYLLATPNEVWSGARVGTVNLEEGDGRVEVVAGAEREIVLAATIDGEPGIPGGLMLARGAEEDPERGEIRYRERIAAGQPKHSVRLNAPPYLSVYSAVDVPPAGPIVHRIDFRSGGEVSVRVRKPADGRLRLKIQRRPEDGRWSDIPTLGLMTGNLEETPNGDFRVAPVEPGTCRVIEERSGVITPAFEVVAGRAAEVTLDLGNAGDVKGKVVLPDGFAARDARVVVEGEGLLERQVGGGAFVFQPAAHVRENGDFTVRVPGDRPVTIRPWHPGLMPAPDGVLTLTEPREGVTLRMVKGARCLFRPEPLPSEYERRRVRVLLFAGDPKGEAVSEHACLFEGDVATIAGYEPGTYTLWIDMPRSAPAVLRDVVLGEAETDLGKVAPPAGSSIRVKILVSEGESPPRIGVFATRKTEPRYTRGMNSGGEAVAVLPGLGPGTFRVTSSPVMGGSPGKASYISKVLTVDGETDVDLVMDLR